MHCGMCRMLMGSVLFFFFSSRRRHTRFDCDWSSDVCSSDLLTPAELSPKAAPVALDPAQLASHTDSSRVLFQGNPVGASVSALRRTADSLVYTEQSNMGGGAFQQTVTLVLDPADGSSRRLDRVTIQQGPRSAA